MKPTPHCHILVSLLVLAGLLAAACVPAAPEPTVTLAPSKTPEQLYTETPQPTNTPLPTMTPTEIPTRVPSPAPTFTVAPTETPKPVTEISALHMGESFTTDWGDLGEATFTYIATLGRADIRSLDQMNDQDKSKLKVTYENGGDTFRYFDSKAFEEVTILGIDTYSVNFTRGKADKKKPASSDFGIVTFGYKTDLGNIRVIRVVMSGNLPNNQPMNEFLDRLRSPENNISPDRQTGRVIFHVPSNIQLVTNDYATHMNAPETDPYANNSTIFDELVLHGLPNVTFVQIVAEIEKTA